MKKTRTCPQCKERKSFPSNRKVCEACRTVNHKVKTGEIRPPDFTEVNTMDYKDPMEPVEDGFGYYGAVTQTNDGLHIQCHICGFYFGKLGAHIKNKHKVEPRDYKIKYGLRIKDGLLSPIAKFAAQIHYNKYTRKSPEEMKEMSRKAAATRKEMGIKAGGDQWTAQTRNEKGACREQTIGKIRRVAELCGGVPTTVAYCEEYGSTDIVLHWFGTWEKGVEAAGLKTYLQTQRNERKRRMRDTEAKIAAFYEEHGRTPQTSDFNSIDELPNYKQVIRLFGSINNARVAAGVPTLVYYRGNWVEVEPGEETDGVVPSTAQRRAYA